MKIKLTDLKVPLFAFDWPFVVIFLCLYDIKYLPHSSFFYFPSSKYILLWPSSLDTEEFLNFLPSYFPLSAPKFYVIYISMPFFAGLYRPKERDWDSLPSCVL